MLHVIGHMMSVLQKGYVLHAIADFALDCYGHPPGEEKFVMLNMWTGKDSLQVQSLHLPDKFHQEGPKATLCWLH